jgi:exonuclease III
VLSVLTVNIAAAARPRAEALLAWLAARDDDVLVLTETSGGAGTAYLLDRFRQAGWLALHAADLAGERRTAVLSSLPATPRPELTAASTPAGRAVALTLATRPAVTVLGVYVPSSDRAPEKVTRKRGFVTTLLAAIDALPSQDRDHLVLAGDYNVVARDHQPPYRGFLDFEYALLDDLAERGLVDAHQHLAPTPRSQLDGAGGRRLPVRFIHTGSQLQAAIRGGAYLHEPREQRLSDHAAVTVTLDVPVGGRLAVDAEALADTGTLF